MQPDEEFAELTVEERKEEIKLRFEETSDPFMHTKKLADFFDADRAVVYRTLENLAKDGFFHKERVGAGGVVYYQMVEELCS